MCSLNDQEQFVLNVKNLQLEQFTKLLNSFERMVKSIY